MKNSLVYKKTKRDSEEMTTCCFQGILHI